MYSHDKRESQWPFIYITGDTAHVVNNLSFYCVVVLVDCFHSFLCFLFVVVVLLSVHAFVVLFTFFRGYCN